MAVHFQSLLSGSSGNAVAIWDEDTRLLIDCGVRAQYRCRELLESLEGAGPPVAGVLVSHLHSDHINYSSLRVIEERGIPLYVHEANVDILPDSHFRKWSFDNLDVRPYSDDAFEVGGLEIRPVLVPHSDWHVTHSFVVGSNGSRPTRRIAVATDLYEWTHAVDEFADVDLVYLEANHDPELLRRHPNANSAFHLENGNAGSLLCEILDRSRRRPRTAVLAHLSEDRNTPQIALETVQSKLEEAGLTPPRLVVAPRYEPSEVLTLE